MATFSDYYAKALAEGAKPRSTPPSAPSVDFSARKLMTDEQADTNGPLSWAIDILSRPLYGVTNAVSGIVDAGVNASQKMAQGDLIGAIGEGVGAGFGSAPKLLEGIFSNDPAVKRTTSDVIEQSTDKIAPTVDPNYVDRVDNVYTVVKGVLGFAGDVAADPLTWIPGGLIVKGAKTAAEAGKTGLEAAAKGLKTVTKGKTAEKAADDLLDEAETVAKVSDEATPLPEENPFLSDAASPKSAKVPEARTPEAPAVKPAAVADELPTAAPTPKATDIVAKVEPTLRELFNTSAKAPAMRKEIADILSGVGKSAKQESPVLTTGAWAKENQKSKPATFFSRQGLDEDAMHPLEKDPLAKKTIGELVAIRQDPRFPKDIKDRATNLLNTAYTGYKEMAEASQTNVVLTALDAFRERAATDRARVELALGPELLAVMERKNTPLAVERALQAVNRALDPETDLEKFFRASGTKQLGPAIQSGLGIPGHVKPTPNTAIDLGKAVASLTEDGVVKDVVAATLQQEALVKTLSKKYPYRKGSQAFTDKDKEIRLGNHWRKLNTFFQYTLYRNLEGVLKKRMTELSGTDRALYGRANAQARRDAIDSVSGEIMDSIQTFGTKMHIGVSDDLLPVTFPEVYRLTFNAFEDSDKALLALYNGGSNVAFTVLMQATHIAAMAGDLKTLGRDGVLALRQEIIDVLSNPNKFGVRGGYAGGKIPNNINKAKAQGYVYPPNQKKAAAAFSKKMGGSVDATDGGAWQVTLPKGALINDLADAIVKAQPSMVQRVADNALTWKQRGLSEASELSNQQIKHTEQLIESGAYKSDVLHEVDSIPKNIADTATEIGATQDAVNMATEVAQASVGDALTQQAAVAVKLEREVKEADDLFDPVEEAAQQTVDNAVERVQKTADEHFDEVTTPDESGAVKVVRDTDVDESIPSVDISDMDPATMFQHVLGSFLNPLKKVFETGYGYKDLEPIWNSSRSVGERFIENATNQLRDIAKTYDAPVIKAAFEAIQRGDAPAHLADAQKAISDVLSSLFRPVGEGSLVDNLFLSTERELGHINAVLKMRKVDGLEFDKGAAKLAAKETYKTEKPTAEQVANELDKQWRSVVVKDPIDWMSRLTDAAVTVAEHRSMAGYFVNFFGEKGLVSKTPKPGMVKVMASGPSSFRAMLPKTLYADPTLASQLRVLDVLTRTSREIEGKVGEALREYYFPLQNAWKKYMTIFRVGHHIRNFIGDSSMTFVARGTRHFASSMDDAYKVLGLKNNYSNIDLIDSMKRIENADTAIPQGGDVLVRGTIGGKPVELTTEAIHALLADKGLLTTFNSAEDLLSDAVLRSPVASAMKKITLDGTKISKLAGGTSEFVAHMGRAQHFIQILKQELSKSGGQYGAVKSLDELASKAAQEVRRAHPDGTMLTGAEHKYMRVLIPFYSWFGKILPFAVQSFLRNPGRVMVFPKASYNLAVANGINPDSLSDPFPEDQLFPSFLTKGAFGPQFYGPDGQYVNINPGFAHTDIASTLSDPVKGIAGMVSPLIRMPAELLSGSTWQGTRINDTSDYLDQNTPVLNYIANITGVSPTGSAASVLQGQGLDQQAQVEKGNKGGFDQTLSALNWLTGVNAQNWSRPNFVNYAEIEKRNAAGGK